jgi:hypothetical protein
MTRSEDLEAREAVGVVLDMAEAMRHDDKEQMALIAETYLSSATSQNERERLFGILLQVFATTVVELTRILEEIQPSALRLWRDGMRRIEDQP